MTNKMIETNDKTLNMMNALSTFGFERDYNEIIIKRVVNDINIVDELIALYDMNEYEIELNEQTETENMLKFLNELNDIECNGIDENFIVIEIELSLQ